MVRSPALLFVFLAVLGPEARAETLGELVTREEGIDFGPCALDPRPDVPGGTIRAVIPARFERPGIWVTRTLLLVGIDEGGAVRGQAELRLAASVPPREVPSVRCAGNRLTLRLSAGASGETFAYIWTGQGAEAIPGTRQAVKAAGEGVPPVRP